MQIIESQYVLRHIGKFRNIGILHTIGVFRATDEDGPRIT